MNRKKFPDGRLNLQDEGQVMIAVGTEAGRIVIHFKEPCKWIGLPPHQARELAQLLILHADKVKQ